jgi:hypothetical protein
MGHQGTVVFCSSINEPLKQNKMRNKNLKKAHALAVAAVPLDYSIIFSNYNLRSDDKTLSVWLKGLQKELTQPHFDQLMSCNSEYRIIFDYIVEKYLFLFENSVADRDVVSEMWDIAIGNLLNCVQHLNSLGDSVSVNSIRRCIQSLIDDIDGDRYLVTLVYTFVDHEGVVSGEFLKEAVFDYVAHATHETALKGVGNQGKKELQHVTVNML